MGARLGVLASGCAIVCTFGALLAPAAQAAGITISGNVTCANGQPVVGVWVQSSGGGSKFAPWTKTGTATASYSTSISTALPTNVSLHVGCGNTPQQWGSSNFSPVIVDIAGSTTFSVTNCVNGQCSPLLAYKAAQWALAHLAGLGANHALSTDKTYDTPGTGAYVSWADLCLEFVASAYLNGGHEMYPIVYTNAKDMYTKYAQTGLNDRPQGLIQTVWTNASGQRSLPPAGAIVFYPGLSKEGHIGIAVGSGYVVTANDYGSPLVREEPYNSANLGPYYAGWAFPINAGN